MAALSGLFTHPASLCNEWGGNPCLHKQAAHHRKNRGPALPQWSSVSSVVKDLARRLIEPEKSLVRNHTLHFEEIAIAHQSGFAQLLLPLLTLRRQNVTQARMPPLHLPRPGFLKALGRALVRFQFRHKSSKSADSISPSAFRIQNFVSLVKPAK